jgi:hypothetical protein
MKIDFNSSMKWAYNNQTAFTDFNIITPTQVLYTHRLILCTNSYYFKTNLFDSLQSDFTLSEDDNEEAFTVIIQSLYEGYLNVEDTQQLIEVILQANKYQFTKIFKAALNTLANNVTMETVLPILRHFDLQDEIYKKLDEKVKQLLKDD